MVINRVGSLDINVLHIKQICGCIFSVTRDKNTSTCVPVVQAYQHLQVIFVTPSLISRNQLSVEVILLNVDDCTSPAWTWFVESECQPGIFTECSRTHIRRVAELTHCAVTCDCVDSCDFLYLKHNRLPRRNQTTERLCEIWVYRKGQKYHRHDKAWKKAWRCAGEVFKCMSWRMYQRRCFSYSNLIEIHC